MKLRNKKTGEVVNVIVYSPIGNYNIRIWNDKDYLDPTCNDEYLVEYKTLAELNEEWEDYKPAEPLIKDEKVRKAVRAWAEANSLKWAAYSADGKFYSKTTDTEISFKTYINRLDIPECKPLPIAELCGEEEE